MLRILLFTLFTLCALPSCNAHAEQKKPDNVLHIYSSRHYDTDEALYDNFTKQTGIEVKRVDGKGDALIARLKQEGDASEADLFITVDAGRLWRADEAGLFTVIQSELLESKIPAHLRHPEDHWFGFSTRARAIIYNPETVKPDEIVSYADLTDPKWKGRICVRSSSNIYNLSLLASFIAADGEDSARTWAQGLLNNLARRPQGGDRDQIRAVAAGVCDVALANSYYYFRMARSDKEADRDVTAKTTMMFPDQNDKGTHINISGAGVLKHANNKEAAIQFLEYLTTDAAQRYFADGNNEHPVVAGTQVNETVEAAGAFKTQDLNVNAFGQHQKKAKMIFDEIKFP